MFAKTCSDSKSCPYRNSTGKHCTMVPRCQLYRIDILRINSSIAHSLCLLKDVVIAKAALIETALENTALCAPRCQSYRKDILTINGTVFSLLKHIFIAKAALVETELENIALCVARCQPYRKDILTINCRVYDC